MNKQTGNWKLTVGRLLAAWKDYPQLRRSLSQFPKGPPIFISGTHRSGTTWVAKMLSVPGLWYVHEPFNPNKEIWHESFTYSPNTKPNPEVDEMIGWILAGGLRQTVLNGPVDHPLMPLRVLKPPIQRTMVKDPLACLLTSYISTHYNFQTLVLFRHPCGFVSSVTRLGWPTGAFLKDLLTRDQLMADHLSPYQDLMEKHANENSIPSAAVLHGVLNQTLWNMVQTQNLKWTRFEDLCAAPIERFRELFEWLNLPYTAETKAHHERLCSNGSTDPADYHTHAVARNSSAMADSWRSQLQKDEIDTVQNIWNQFDVPLYMGDFHHPTCTPQVPQSSESQ